MIKDIKNIECTYSCWMTIDVEDFSAENLELWESGRVKRFWVKHTILHMELDDGTIVEEDCSYNEIHEDFKRPDRVMINVNDEWSEYNE